MALLMSISAFLSNPRAGQRVTRREAGAGGHGSRSAAHIAPAALHVYLHLCIPLHSGPREARTTRPYRGIAAKYQNAHGATVRVA